MTKLVSGVDFSLCPTSNQINVCRSNILKCSLQAFQRRRFNPEANLDVVFVDEDMNAEVSVDEGGPTRDFLSSWQLSMVVLRAMKMTADWHWAWKVRKWFINNHINDCLSCHFVCQVLYRFLVDVELSLICMMVTVLLQMSFLVSGWAFNFTTCNCLLCLFTYCSHGHKDVYVGGQNVFV